MQVRLFAYLILLVSLNVVGQTDTIKVNLDFNQVSTNLSLSPSESTILSNQVAEQGQTVFLPNSYGDLIEFRVVEYSMLPEALAKDIRTFHGVAVQNKNTTCRITLAYGKLQASINYTDATYILEKDKDVPNTNSFILIKSNPELPSCGVSHFPESKIEDTGLRSVAFTSHGTQLRTYRLALVVTSAFYTAGGNNDNAVNAYIVSIVNNINALYEKEIAVRFTLVSPNNPVSTNLFSIFNNTSLSQVNTELNTRFGSSNFDIGHILLPSGGGVAQLGVVCGTSKGRGLSGVSPTNILVFAHELGHQFSADHTFNGNGSGNCGPANRGDQDAMEPGSGNTIMSYANLCTPEIYDLIGGKVPYFHTRSLTSMIQHITTRPPGCGVLTNTGNTAPVVVTPSNFTIPKNTPFEMVGSATDAENDILNFTWEQYDVAAVTDTGALGNTPNANGVLAVTSTTAPLFRTRSSSSPKRIFPQMQYILNDGNNPVDQVGEDLPQVARTMNFRLTVRDNKANGGAVGTKGVLVTVANVGPLKVNSYNTASTISAGANVTLNWLVNGTQTLSSNVKISLSIDGGASFPIVLSESTPNDGSHSLTIPANTPASTNARIKIASIGSNDYKWFDVNDAKITITSSCGAIAKLICPTSTVNGNAGDPSLNLNLGSFNGQLLSQDNNTQSFTNASNLGLYVYTDDNRNSCNFLPWNPKGLFLKIRVSTTGTYTINPKTNSPTRSNASNVSTIFSSANFNCSSFVSSNGENAVSWSGSYSTTLNTCTDYWIVIYGVFDNETSATFNVNGPGDVYVLGNDPSGFSTTYAAINKATGTIAAISASSNFTTLGGGNYEVKALNYPNGLNPATFVGGTESTAFASGSCIAFGSNSKELNIIALPCPNTLTLVSTANDISSGTQTFQSSNVTNPGLIQATNTITGGNVTYDAGKKVELNPGFQVSTGAVFQAKIGGCAN